MALLGNKLQQAYSATAKDTFNGDGSTVAFTLSRPSRTNDVEVFVENVQQEPTVAYAVSGTTLTFTEAPASGTGNIYVIHRTQATQSLTVNTDDIVDGSITSAKLAEGAVTDPTPAVVSGVANTATDFFALPKGTTAQRPGSPDNGYIRYNTTEGYIEEYRDGAWQVLSNVFSATGGTVTTYTSGGVDYKSHTFTSAGTFTVLSGTTTADILVVAGGGGGGAAGGGGGAGGFQTFTSETLSAGAYTITVGGGGSGANGNGDEGVNGNPSSFGSLTQSVGGGGGGGGNGGANPNDPGNGGSGGGAGRDTGGTGGSGTSGQGNSGGSVAGTSATGGGGGGGAGQAGTNDTSGSGGSAVGDSGVPPDGGDGLSNTYKDGTSIYYAGGGGGPIYDAPYTTAAGSGGLGGGGDGAKGNTNVAGGHATANTGGGGGGSVGSNNAGGPGGNGGSGIVIIRYAV